jgi:serine/threonine protein kinase
VWEADDAEGRRVAIKILRARGVRTEPYQRFRREVQELRRLGDFSGVLPLLDSHIPERPSQKERAWLVMPVAEPIRHALGDDPRIDVVVEAVATVAETLDEPAMRGIAHRDIKPENLYRSESSWVIGDFGLIDAPNVDPLTVGAHELGPRNYLAPEMVLDAANADGAAADVYSLGKTLWVLLTSLPMPPPGELSRVVDGKRLADRGVQHPRAFRLERLLEQMTKESPKSRPPMAEVAKTLRNWVASSGGSTDDPESKEMNLEDVVEAVAEVFTGTPLSTNRNRIEDKR